MADLDGEKLLSLSKSKPDVITTTNANDIFYDDNIDSVVISSFVSSHYPLAKSALEAGKNVLVEKPLTTSKRNGEELINLALKNNVMLMIDHTYLYSNAILEIKKILHQPEFENLRIIESNRSNFGLLRTDVNALFDLASHDVSILCFLLEKMPVTIRAIGFKFQGDLEQIAQVFLRYENGCQASLYCSWVSPNKIRKINFIAQKKTISFDDLSADNKLEIFDNQANWYPQQRDTLLDAQVNRTGLYIKFEEPLFNMVTDFKNSIQNKTQPRSNMFLGLDVVKILEKAYESMTLGGIELELDKLTPFS